MSEDSKQNKKTSPHPTAQPSVAEHFLKRPAVEHLLCDAFKKPLATIIAGAGYGKTQAVLSALAASKRTAFWIPLSELDNHFARFWERLSAAFAPQSLALHDSLLALGYPESVVSFDQFLKLLAREIKKPVVLVLDDFHLIHNETVLHFIALFISARVQNVSLVLLSRKSPDISLTSLLSKGLSARITEDDLRFSKDEMNDYLLMRGVSLSESVIEDMYAYTDGWIFAICLAGLVSQKAEMFHRNPVLAAKIDIFDLIEKEIFWEASEELRDFLIQLSILDVIPAALLKKLAGGNPSLISEMMQLSTFIRYDAFSDSYRIHQLFKEFLQEKKDALDLSKIHLAAAEWYSDNNDPLQSIYHYKKINRYREIFEHIISIPGRVPRAEADAVVALIEQAPIKWVRTMPIIRVVKAGYLFNNNRLAQAKEELRQLRETLEALPEADKNQSVLGEVYLLLALIAFVSLDYDFETLFKEAAARLPGGSKLIDSRTGIAEGLNACSIKNPSAGELQRHQDALFRVAPYASRAMNGCGYGLEYLNAAESALYTGNWKVAEKHAYEAIYRSRQYRQYDIEYMANFVLVRIFTARGNNEKVTELLEQMKAQLETLQDVECLALYDIISGWFYMKLGKTDRVAKWIKHEEETRKILAPVLIGREYLVRSDCLLTEERYFELLAFMKLTDKMYEDRGILFAVIQNKITKAMVHHCLGNHAAAITHLTEAYELTYPNDLIMQFIEYGNRMRALIHAARQNSGCTIPREWLDKIYTKSSSYAKMLSSLVSQYNAAHETERAGPVSLSKREFETLVCLFKGMTRKEMAAAHYLSLSTINSVLKNIYDKLGAANAAEAVRIAKEKNLV